MTQPAQPFFFSSALLAWYDKYGRKDLPWQHPRSAYRVWVSEVMLQQTQVATVIPYFNRFMERFPTLHSLSQAHEDEVLALWSGLGYYSRARHLLHAAKMLEDRFSGNFPSDPDVLCHLPGIGLTTAAAIAAQAFDVPAAILDGNVKRVLARFYRVEGQLSQRVVLDKLWQRAKDCMPQQRCADYTQAIMDLGATCCTLKNPQCEVCPLNQQCQAYHQGQVADIPNKPVKKNIPTKAQRFLLLQQPDQTVYLERRPGKGLWAGLWCMPGIDQEEEPVAYVESTYGFSVEKVTSLGQIKHSFSHYHLHIEALLLTILPTQAGPGQWFSREHALKLGLAKPTTVIIRDFIPDNHIA